MARDRAKKQHEDYMNMMWDETTVKVIKENRKVFEEKDLEMEGKKQVLFNIQKEIRGLERQEGVEPEQEVVLVED